MDFGVKLSWDPDFSPVQDAELVRAATGTGAATREEFAENTGKDYANAICEQLWDSPQVNWDGKILGCCRNFWGDFGGNAFTDGLTAALNGEKISYAREMLTGKVPAREDVPCTSCEMYQSMQKTSEFMPAR